jgi:hypothetical protein
MAIANDTRTVVGVFNSVQDAQAAVRELESMGVSRESVSIVANKNAVGYDSMDAADRDKASDVVADAGIGAAIGGVGGLLLSAAGAITLPVIGPILAAGPIAAALTGAGIGAAAGGLIGALTESGIPEEHAKYYAEGVRRGDVLVTVRAEERRADQVCDILDRHNAVDVDERVQNWRDRGWSGYQTDAKPYTNDELRTERSYYGTGYTGGTLTGREGIGVDRERSALHRDRDDLTPPVGTTRRSNQPGGIGTTSTTGTWADTTHGGRDISDKYDDRGVMERAGDKMREWKEDIKDTGRELRDEARENQRKMDNYESGRASGGTGYTGTGYTGDPGYTGSTVGDTTREAGRDLKEMGRDVNDVLHGRTGKQPHDIAEERREAERRRRARVYDRTIL